MRIAYLDCFSGISGDMFLGALVDAGVSPRLLEQTVAALNIGARLEISRVTRGEIAATKVDVYTQGEKDLPREAFWQQELEHAHSHSGHHGHVHADHHEIPGERSMSSPDTGESSVPTLRAGMPAPHTHEHQHGRGPTEIRQIITSASISESAKKTAISIFEALGAAEAEIHATTIERVHFHEVGAVDAMVDIVCAAVGAEALGVDEWVCSPLNVGSGTVKCAHGVLPVPAPATVKLLAGAPVFSSGPQVELVTPTGAAIVKTLVKRFASLPAMTLEKSGYGAGTRDFHDQPNVLRLTLGESVVTWATQETISVLEANLDDLSPQVVGYAMERLLAEGALDVFGVPVQMKKSRSGSLLTVLAKPADADRLTKLIFAETSTIGVRRRDEQRMALERRWESVETQWGPVRIKIANMNGSVSNYAPEYEDCRALAEAHQVPLRRIMEEALRNFGARR